MTTDVILYVCLIIIDVIGLSLFQKKKENIRNRWIDIFLWDWIWYGPYYPKTDTD